MNAYSPNPSTGKWEPAQPIAWQEEHGLLVRVLLFLTGTSHCGKGKYQWKYHD